MTDERATAQGESESDTAPGLWHLWSPGKHSLEMRAPSRGAGSTGPSAHASTKTHWLYLCHPVLLHDSILISSL